MSKIYVGTYGKYKPELLEGSPALTISVINGIQRKYKYASGCLAFRSAEQPTRAELLRILDQFKKVVAPGLEADQFNALFVLHREQRDKATGLEGFHVHFVLPMTMLGGQNSKGKSLAGKRWNPQARAGRLHVGLGNGGRCWGRCRAWAVLTDAPDGFNDVQAFFELFGGVGPKNPPIKVDL